MSDTENELMRLNGSGKIKLYPSGVCDKCGYVDPPTINFPVDGIENKYCMVCMSKLLGKVVLNEENL